MDPRTLVGKRERWGYLGDSTDIAHTVMCKAASGNQLCSTGGPAWCPGMACVLSCIQLFVTLWTVARQAPLSI